MVQIFKGIALFTPGGDLIYCIDPTKQGRWHINLCASLQEKLGLPEPPHFLVPGYTATIDLSVHPKTDQLQIWAEVYPPVQHYQVLLNEIFDTRGLVWEIAPWQEESCHPMVIETYRQRFPQLWQENDLVSRLEVKEDEPLEKIANPSSWLTPNKSSYVLHLFVSGRTIATQKALKSLHQLLEEGLNQPYTLKVIDILKNPEEAEFYQVSATPTLLRVTPQPLRRIVGNFDDLERILEVITSK